MRVRASQQHLGKSKTLVWTGIGALLFLLLSFTFTYFIRRKSASTSIPAISLVSSERSSLWERFQCSNQSFYWAQIETDSRLPLNSISRPIQALQSHDNVDPSQYTVGVIIPFRNRTSTLIELHSKLTSFIEKQNVSYKIIVVNQSDSFRFNRGALINVGVRIAMAYGCDYFSVQDVDLLPVHPAVSFRYPKGDMYVMSPREYHPTYRNWKPFFGGNFAMRFSSFLKLNGFSNSYWAWGGEDDDMKTRVLSAMRNGSGFTVWRPIQAKYLPEGTKFFKHYHGKELERDKKVYFGKITHDPDDGYSQSNFACSNVYVLNEEGVSALHTLVVDIALYCDVDAQPWCSDENVVEWNSLSEEEKKKVKRRKRRQLKEKTRLKRERERQERTDRVASSER
mmetsp:Transcript_147/g.259  ORF Transcript_147/g.259 Transcript_147/m.259 type:complete len:395 (-) Transcript_147:235-1419(-)